MPKTKKTVQEQTAAESKSIGFEYQYYYFLFQLLQLQSGQTVGYEVKDDVHIDTPDGKQILIQLKHSIETKSNGDIANLTAKDEDLWKTINNWVKIINDPVENRTTLETQIAFINITQFFLITNKSNSDTNEVFTKLAKYQSKRLTIHELKSYLSEISTPKEEKTTSVVDNYIINVLNQVDEWLEEFFQRIFIIHNQDDLINQIRLKIKEKNVVDSRLDDVFAAVDSHLRKMMYEDVKSRKKFSLHFDDYHKNFTRFFELGRSRKLPIKLGGNKVQAPQNAVSYLLIRQLIDAEILSDLDTDFDDNLVRIFTSKYEMHNHLERWIQQGEISEDERKVFDEEAIAMWRNIFDDTYHSLKRKLRNASISQISQDEVIDLASECYFNTLRLKLSIDDTELTTSMSNGQFYLLSDQPSIGWHFSWKEWYKV